MSDGITARLDDLIAAGTVDLTAETISAPEPDLTGIAAKGAEITSIMLAEEVGYGWRFGDILTLVMQLTQNAPPKMAAPMAAEILERVLHNAFVKAKIPPYDRPEGNAIGSVQIAGTHQAAAQEIGL